MEPCRIVPVLAAQSRFYPYSALVSIPIVLAQYPETFVALVTMFTSLLRSRP